MVSLYTRGSTLGTDRPLRSRNGCMVLGQANGSRLPMAEEILVDTILDLHIARVEEIRIEVYHPSSRKMSQARGPS